MTETGLMIAAEPAMVVAKVGMQRIEEHAQWPLLSRVPLGLTASIPVRGFKVRDLLALEVGGLVKTAWLSIDDVPVRLGDVTLSWSEFEVIEGKMAVRLTRLA